MGCLREFAISAAQYRKVLEIYAFSIDYDPRTEITRRFFKTVQNKMHFAALGHTAAEVAVLKANT